MAIKQRAVSDEEKLERRQAILVAALQLLAEEDYHEISISSIAARTGLAKGTIFLYFRTKEELFLQLQIAEYKAWFNDINSRLHALLQRGRTGNIEAFVRTIAASAADHPTLLRLTPILHITLERNIDYKTALEFKRFLLSEMQATGALIEQCLPFLRKQDGARFLLELQIVLIGLIQMSHPAPLVEQVLRKEGLQVLEVDFEKKLRETLTLLLNGRKATHSK